MNRQHSQPAGHPVLTHPLTQMEGITRITPIHAMVSIRACNRYRPEFMQFAADAVPKTAVCRARGARGTYTSTDASPA